MATSPVASSRGGPTSHANGSTAAQSTTSATEPNNPADAATGSADCLLGDWVVSDTELQTYYTTVAASSAFDTIDSSGEVRISFGPTTFTWTNEYVLNLTIGANSYTAELGGQLSGTYTADSSQLTGIIDHDTRSGIFTEDDNAIEDAGDLFVGVIPTRPLDTTEFSCDGPTLNIAVGPRATSTRQITLTAA